MGKQSRARVLPETHAKAVGTMIRTSPRKLNLVAQTIRGQKVESALNALTFSPKRVRESGQEGAPVGDRQCGEQPRPRRRRSHRLGGLGRQEPRDEALHGAGARGRGAGIQKPFAQITIVVQQKPEDAEEKTAKGKAKRKPAAKKPVAKAAAQETRLMGQKVNPIGLRLGINRTWDSRWYAGKKDFGRLLQEDIKIREYLSEKLKAAGVSKIVIERPHKKCRITIHSARPGVVIARQEGRRHREAEERRAEVHTADEVHLNIVEIRKPEIDAKLVAENIDICPSTLERRVAFRRVMKRAVQSAQRLGARSASASNAAAASAAPRSRASSGTTRAAFRCTRCAPTSTTAWRPAKTTYGTCGVKVWIFKGEIMEHDPMAQDKRAAEAEQSRGGGERRERQPAPRGCRLS